MNPSTVLKKFAFPIMESASNVSPPNLKLPSFLNETKIPRTKLKWHRLKVPSYILCLLNIVFPSNWIAHLDHLQSISTYLISVTNWTLPAIVIFSQVPPLKSLFRFAIMNQKMNTKFGTNINITIQNPHQVSPLSICSFPTMISPLNNKKEEALDDWGWSFCDTICRNSHLTHSTFIYITLSLIAILIYIRPI